MTMSKFTEIETWIESQAGRFMLKDDCGAVLSGREAVWKVAEDFPDQSENLWLGLRNGTLTMKEYFEGWKEIFSQYEKNLFVRRLEEKLLSFTKK